MQRSTWQRIEYGESAYSMDLVWRIADVLAVPVTWLVTDEWVWPAGHPEEGEPTPPARRH